MQHLMIIPMTTLLQPSSSAIHRHRQQSVPKITEREAEVCAPARPRLTGTPEVTKQIEQALQATGYRTFRNLHVRVAGGRAILRGRVPSYYLKQKAQAVTLTVCGVDEVQNELEVVFPKLDHR